jgi:hypothetical protein
MGWVMDQSTNRQKTNDMNNATPTFASQCKHMSNFKLMDYVSKLNRIIERAKKRDTLQSRVDALVADASLKIVVKELKTRTT